jgi:hypothetical protein
MCFPGSRRKYKFNRLNSKPLDGAVASCILLKECAFASLRHVRAEFPFGFFPESGNPSISRGSSAGREFKKLPVFREAWKCKDLVDIVYIQEL